MTRMVILFSVFFFLILPIFLNAEVPISAEESVSSPNLKYQDHSSIYIKGDGYFTKYNGVVNGSGTHSDPYIIEGWNISGGSSPALEKYWCIRIENTSAHFIVRNCIIGNYLPSSQQSTPIWLTNVTNGTFENLYCMPFSKKLSGSVYIGMRACSNIIIKNITFAKGTVVTTIFSIGENCRRITIENVIDESVSIGNFAWFGTCSEITLRNNIMSKGVELDPEHADSWSTHSIDSSNTINDKPILYLKNLSHYYICENNMSQLIIANCTNIIITGLKSDWSLQYPINIGCSSHVRIVNNKFEKYGSIFNLADVHNVDISYNVFGGSEILYNIHLGIILHSTNVRIHHNNILINSIYYDIHSFLSSGINSIYFNDSCEGNYWPPQLLEICDVYDNDGNGIGDKPLPVDPIANLTPLDYYPLMRPASYFDFFPIATYHRDESFLSIVARVASLRNITRLVLCYKYADEHEWYQRIAYPSTTTTEYEFGVLISPYKAGIIHYYFSATDETNTTLSSIPFYVKILEVRSESQFSYFDLAICSVGAIVTLFVGIYLLRKVRGNRKSGVKRY